MKKVNSSKVEVWVGNGFTNGRNQNTSLGKIIRKIHQSINVAYEENLDANCEPNNDKISGNLAYAKDLLERYFI